MFQYAKHCVEHRGVANRTLCKLGWVTNMRHRKNPRFEDLDFRSEELLQYRENLIQKLHDPTAFILDVFGSDDDIWVERCLKIIRPKDL